MSHFKGTPKTIKLQARIRPISKGVATLLIPQIQGLKGPKGDPGERGKSGPQGTRGESVTGSPGTTNYNELENKPTLFSGVYADLSGKPSLFSGVYADLSGKPTLGTASASNVGDFATAAHAHTFDSLTSKPTTISGYGILDAFTQAAADALYSVLAHVHAFADLTSKPTTLSGYGITDAQPTDSDLDAIAALTTTAFGRSFLDRVNAAAGRTLLELGSLATQSGTFSGTSSNTNTGDQTSIVGITGSVAEFNAALTGADFATGGGTATGTNTGDNATNTQYSGLAASKQDTLVSATNIKTINGSSVLGAGDLVVSGAAAISQTEVDFGSTPVEEALFTIADAAATATSKIIGSIAYAAPTGKDLDELEMDSLELTFGPKGVGEFYIYARGADGYVADKFKINYQIAA